MMLMKKMMTWIETKKKEKPRGGNKQVVDDMATHGVHSGDDKEGKKVNQEEAERVNENMVIENSINDSVQETINSRVQGAINSPRESEMLSRVPRQEVANENIEAENVNIEVNSNFSQELKSMVDDSEDPAEEKNHDSPPLYLKPRRIQIGGMNSQLKAFSK